MIKHIYSYPTFADLVQKAHGSTDMTVDSRVSRRDNDGWSGASWEKASMLSQQGDMEGARRLSPSILEAVNAMAASQPRLDPVYRLDEGRWIDVARYVKGEPECWGDMVESEPMPRKGLAIVVNVSVHAGISSKKLDRVGVEIGGIVIGLQSMGYAVTLGVGELIESHDTGEKLCVYAPLNPNGSPLDVSKLSVILRPWFLRRILFSLEETFPKNIRKDFGISSWGGYGAPCSIKVPDAQNLTGNRNVVVINVGEAVDDPQSVRDQVLRQLKGGK